MQREISPVVMVHGGGTGPLEVERAFLKHTPNVISGTGGADDGGDTGRYRKELDIPGIGDATRRMSIHVPDLLNQEFFVFRWQGDHGLNGQRPVNAMLASFVQLEHGSISRGIRRMEKFMGSGYVGRVVVLSDDYVDLKVTYEDGSFHLGEKYIDALKPDSSPIAKVEYHPGPPKVNEEYLYAARSADVNIIAPGTWHGSIEPILLPEVIEAMQEAREENGALTIWVCNAFTQPETQGWKASRFVDRLHQLGLDIDLAFLNRFNHSIPESYPEADTHPIIVDDKEVERCREFAQEVLVLNLTYLDVLKEQPYLTNEGIKYRSEKPVVRHDGEPIADITMKRLEEKNVWVATRNRFMHNFFNGL